MNKLNIGMLSGLIAGGIGAAIGIYASINPEGVATLLNSPQGMVAFPIFIAALVIIPITLSFGPLAISAIKNSRKKKRLRQIGVKGTAKILSVQDTGVTINMAPYVKITVQTSMGTQAEFNMLVSRVGIPRPGDEIEILYDPADPTIAMAT